MRRILAIALMLTALCGAARAQLHAYEYDSTYYKCVDFEQELPEDVMRAFSGILREGDEVICGARKTKYYVRSGREDWDTSILLAVRREGRILLMHASGINDDFTVTIETDGFLAPDAGFAIRTQPEDRGTLMTHQVVAGDMVYSVSRRSYDGNRLWITEAERTLEDGTVFVVRPGSGHVGWKIEQEETTLEQESRIGVFPDRLAAWAEEDFPRTKEALYAWMDAHVPALDRNEAYTAGVNLRERATGESPSWGKYTAKVCVLGEAPGITAPWYHVEAAGLKGWVSGDYLVREDSGEDDRLCEMAGHLADVGCVRKETALCSAPDGAAGQRLGKGTIMHVLGERNGWLHVIVPRGELTWQTDWDGACGFVKAEDVSVGVSEADAIWQAERNGDKVQQEIPKDCG